MKYFFKNIIVISLTILFLLLLFTNKEIAKNSISSSIYIWIYNIIPSLFPMIIINDILINYDFPKIVCSIFYKLFNKIFKLSYSGTYIFIMSMFIGTPTNAMLIKNMLDANSIDIDEANKLIYVCYFSNPLFLFNMLSLIFKTNIVLLIIISHYISNIIILFLIRNKYIPKNYHYFHNKHIKFNKLITNSINKAINTMISILGIISFYMLITSYIKNNILFSGLLEITTGLNLISHSFSKYKLIMTIIIVNFGGLSIFTQIKSILEDTNIYFINYFKGRILQIIISVLLITSVLTIISICI